MAESKLNIKWIGSPNFRPLKGVKKKFIVMHWMAGRLPATDRLFQDRKHAVATNYGIADGTVHQYVAEKDYNFGSGTTYSNTYGIAIEHEGGWLLANGKRKKPSKATHDTSARLCAEISKRWGLGKLVVGKNVFPHKHFVSTACPGSLDLDYIVAEANKILEQEAHVMPPVTGPVTPVKPVTPSDAKYVVVKPGDSYWLIAVRVLGVTNNAVNAMKILRESKRIQKLNHAKALHPGDKVRVK